MMQPSSCPALPTETRRASAPPLPRDFTVDGWLVQPTLNRVSRGDTTRRVRPQMMDVLVHLAAAQGRMVSRQDVYGAVWCDRFVSDSSLSRVVAELRSALDDDARHPRIIETIPKRGYRVIAPVVRVAAEPVQAAGLPEAPAPHEQASEATAPSRWPFVPVVVAAALLVLVILFFTLV